MQRGRFVTFEGPDGSGKTTQARAVAERLRSAGKAVQVLREPGGTALGEEVRTLLLAAPHEDRAPAADAFLFSAARAQLVVEVIRPALARGDVVLCDRYADSTLAYQGYGEGMDLAALRSLQELATDGVRPDLTILLDAPVERTLARRSGGPPEELQRFERSARHGAAFHDRVRNGYLALARAEPDRWRVVDADRPPAAVAVDVWLHVTELLAVPAGVSSEPQGEPVRIDS